jgi:hypothetical protein
MLNCVLNRVGLNPEYTFWLYINEKLINDTYYEWGFNKMQNSMYFYEKHVIYF